ncbi:hypothetical protein [Natronoarchaeum rubrum]|uniref:hypothetical protein n=1 Tax=Natronoarchaeum rubrum TaxID=755311 RepID=UPI002112315C|nr:hypothetical protein [Natronoarchaeum rubrum]HMB49863.1 hypothetical protein [Natronoarchaeum rubrum]
MQHCSACGERIPLGDAQRCGCGQTVHARCLGYHAEFECDASRERWIGAQEF